MKHTFTTILCLVLTSALLLGCIGCSPSAESPKVSEDPGSTSTETTPAAQQNAPQDTPAAETLKIGVMVPMTGGSVLAGEQLIQACQMMSDLINNGSDIGLPLTESEGLPNLGGMKVEFVVGDCVTAESSLSEAERLITEENVSAIIGLYGSGQTKTALVSSEKYGIPLLSPASTESLCESGNKYFFRSTAHDGQYIESTYEFLQYMNETQGAEIKTVAAICEDTDFGANLLISATEDAEKYGFEFISGISYSASANNFSSEVMKLKAANPDAVIMATFTSDGIQLIKTFKEQDFNPKLIVGQRAGFQQTDFLSTLGADAQYLCSTTPWAGDIGFEMADKLCKLYKEQYSGGVDLIGWVASAMIDFYIAAYAYNQAGEVSPDAFKSAMLTGLDFDQSKQFAAVNGFSYDENGQITSFLPLVMQVQDGAYKTVFPADNASCDVKFPIPAWNER